MALLSILGVLLAFWIVRSAHRTLASYGQGTPHLSVTTGSINATVLGPYYVDLGGDPKFFLDSGTMLMGSSGVPVVHDGRTIENNPVNVAQYAFELYHAYLDHQDEVDRNAFLHQADWLVHFCERGCIYDFAHPPQISNSGWVSGMAQGQAISVELRAYELTHSPKYLTAAKTAFAIPTSPIERGGTLFDASYGTWFEEYPQRPPTHVLNGHMFALFGLWDYYKITRDPRARALFASGVAAARHGVVESDTGYWARYDLAHAALAQRNYLDIEILQVQVLADMSGEKALRAISARFLGYESSPFSYVRIWFHNLRHPRGLYERV